MAECRDRGGLGRLGTQTQPTSPPAACLQGKLDQKQSTLQISSVAGRDIRPEQLMELQHGLSSW